MKYSNPPPLFINIDETGVCLLPCQKRTWGPTGAKQISAIGILGIIVALVDRQVMCPKCCFTTVV